MARKDGSDVSTDFKLKIDDVVTITYRKDGNEKTIDVIVRKIDDKNFSGMPLLSDVQKLRAEYVNDTTVQVFGGSKFNNTNVIEIGTYIVNNINIEGFNTGQVISIVKKESPAKKSPSSYLNTYAGIEAGDTVLVSHDNFTHDNPYKFKVTRIDRDTNALYGISILPEDVKNYGSENGTETVQVNNTELVVGPIYLNIGRIKDYKATVDGISKVDQTGGKKTKPTNLKDLNMKQLRQMASQRNLKGCSKLCKDELIKTLRRKSAGPAPKKSI